jgi:recombination protein RecA
MARKKATEEESGTTPGAAPKGAKLTSLARMLAASKQVLKTDSWEVDLDVNAMKESHPHIPTGSFVLDYLIGGVPNAQGVAPCPGLPRGRITQIWGAEGTGKTTVGKTISASCCALGGTVLYVDWEFAFETTYAKNIGVPIGDKSRFSLVQPATLEEGLRLIHIAAVAGVDLIVIDSVGSASPEAVVNRPVSEMGDQSRIGLAAQKWGEFMKTLRKEIMTSHTAVLGISQVRAKIGGMGYGPQSEPQGGNAWKFNSDVRIDMRRISQEKYKIPNRLTNKIEERPYGSLVRAKIVKCRVSDSNGREDNFYIRHGEGVDDIRSIIDIAATHKLINKKGSWLYYQDHSWRSIEVARKFFANDKAAFNELTLALRPILHQGNTSDDSSQDEMGVEDLLDMSDVDIISSTED